MRKSREETARTHEKIIAAAASEFRKNGVVATGLADLMKAADLTHGGFYKHFDSKESLVREVTAASIDQTTSRLRQTAQHRPGRKGLISAIEEYLSIDHRDDPGSGCAFATIGPELTRSDARTRTEATEGFLKFVDVFAGKADWLPPEEARKKAIAAATMMIGAMTVARIVNNAELSKRILRIAADSAVDLFE